MNTIRMIAIALPIMLLLACGGGGSSGGATAVAPTTPMTGNPNPPADDGNGMPITPQPLPSFLFTDANLSSLRTLTGGSEVTPAMTSAQIEQTLQMRANAASRLIFSDIFEGSGTQDVTCSGTTCSGSLSGGTNIEFSLGNFENGPEINDQALTGYNEEYVAVMTDSGVTLGQRRAAGRDGNTNFEFQSYGGWLSDNIFAIQFEKVINGSDTVDYFTAYSFGKESGSNPQGIIGLANWSGVMVGMHTGTNQPVQGDIILAFIGNANTVSLTVANIKNLVTEADISQFTQTSIPVTNGRFATGNGDIRGSFYGDEHGTVGGILNRNSILGAFGAVRE